MKQICTIGGGSGMPVINEALVTAGFKNIKSIVTTFDNGGDTGRIRTDERGQALALSDYWRSLVSLWPDSQQKDVWLDMLRFRDGRGRNFGNAFFQFLSEKTNLEDIDDIFCHLTGAKLHGTVIPVTLTPAQICFQVQTGRIYVGENLLDELRLSYNKVEKVWLSKEVKANENAINSILDSDVIIVCPGSMYGSVIANFLPKGVKAAYQKSKAKKILMTNIMSMPNESHGFDEHKYVQAFEAYLGKDPFDLVLMPDLKKINSKLMLAALTNYKLDHSFPVLFNSKNNNSYKVLVEDIAIVEEVKKRFRHSEVKLAKLFKKIL